LYGVTDGTYSPTTRQIREAINIGIRDGTDKVVGYGKRIMKQGHY
jgi:tRNA threonylcarbamoyladenosine modification (KEOPS) complex Cgi121 subunit